MQSGTEIVGWCWSCATLSPAHTLFPYCHPFPHPQAHLSECNGDGCTAQGVKD